MKWQYDPFQQIATNTESGMRFSVKGPNGDAIEIEAASPAASKCSCDDLAVHKREISRAVNDEITRRDMIHLIHSHFSRSYAEAARIITNRSGHKVSERSIQAWLIDPGKPSSRRCPGWALKALKEHFAENGRDQIRRHDAPSPIPRPWSAEVFDTKAVGMATDRIESERRKRDEWRSLSFSALADKLFELEKRTDEWLCAHNGMLHSIASAVRASNNFDDMKSALLASLDEASLVEFFVRDARTAIERHQAEFSNDEGVVAGPSGPQTR